MDGGSEGGGRRWWQTLPGTITAIAGLVTAITGLVVAVQQLWPSSGGSHAAPRAGNAAQLSTTEKGSGGTIAGAYRVAFPAGRRALVGDFRYDVLTATAEGGNPGDIVLTLRVRMTNDSPYPANFWNATFRLRAGAETSAPTNFLDEVVGARTTKTGQVVFTLPASTERAALHVGDDAANAVELPVVLLPKG